MKYEGIYKAVKIVKNVEGEGFVFFDIDTLLSETEDPGEKQMLAKTLSTLIMVGEDASINQIMEVPAGLPAEEIEKAKSMGTVFTPDGKYVVTKANTGKFENEELYLYDASKFLAGSEWVKISTDVEDEINLVTTVYKKL